MAPQLRKLLHRRIIANILIGSGLGLTAGCVWKFGYAEPKKAKYAAYYKNFDADKAAKEMEARLAAKGISI